MKPLVVIESPYAGDVATHVAYARKALRHAILKGEAPLAGHLLYVQVLRDEHPEERALGISCHLATIDRADLVAVYTDHGISRGMQQAIEYANDRGVPVEHRSIANWEVGP